MSNEATRLALLEEEMSDDTLSERVMLACLEADEVLYNICDVNDFITWAIEQYKKVDAVFENGRRYKDHELYRARRYLKLAERKALETGKQNVLRKGYQRISKVCMEVAREIQKKELDRPFKSLIPYYERGKQILMNDAEKYAILAEN